MPLIILLCSFPKHNSRSNRSKGPLKGMMLWKWTVIPSLVDLNVLSINLSSVFSMQAQGVSWNTITANHLFNDLVGAGVLRFPIFCDEGPERFCRWHLTELHITDQCQIFKNFLIKQTARGFQTFIEERALASFC